MFTINADIHPYGTRQSSYLHHGIARTAKARKCIRYLLSTLIDNKSQAILTRCIMQAFVIQGIVTYVKDILDKTEWCILLMKPIWNESPILRSLDVKLVKWWTVLASD